MSKSQDKKNKNVEIGFEQKTIELKVDDILPLRRLSLSERSSRKYKQIMTSIKEVGIIEPIVVTKEKTSKDRYVLLEGHMRLEALKDLGETSTVCLIANDDEAFTYNRFISRQAPIQEHKMIQRAIANGASEEKIARALNVNVRSILQKKSLLDGICPEVVDLLKDKMVPTNVFYIIKKMKPVRQIEMATLMVDSNVFKVSFAKMLMETTPKEQLLNPEKPKVLRTLSEEKRLRMQEELSRLEREYKLVKDDRGQKTLVLQFAKNYITRLLENSRITRYLSQNHPDIFEEFQKIVEMTQISQVSDSPAK